MNWSDDRKTNGGQALAMVYTDGIDGWLYYSVKDFEIKVPSSEVVFISETPVGVHERTVVKEHLVRHGSKHKIQVHKTKRNKQQQKQNRTHFQNKKQRETREKIINQNKS